MQPQDALLANDYAAQKAIPRSQRQRVFINSVTSTYVPTLADGQQPPTTLEDAATANIPVDQWFGEDNAPHFVLRIEGTTPLNSADTQLDQRFLQWFRDNADQEGRPYKFVFKSGVNPLKSLDKVGLNGTQNSGLNGGGFRGGYGNTPPRRSTGNFGNPDPGNYGGFGQTGGRGVTASTNVEELLPLRPLADEDQREDWKFVVELQVQLKSPQDARPRVDPTPSDTPPVEAGSPAEDTPPASPTAGPVAVPDPNVETIKLARANGRAEVNP